tara:strand:+ start:535 stop:1509 length:975 start_codon:yes stop_codon:yes gene_type:complete
MAYLTNRQAPNSGLANLLAMKGRMGDTELVHMSKPEIDMLERMGEMTRNPMTGLPEAFSLEDEITGLASLMNMPSAKNAMTDLMEFGKEKLKSLAMKDMPPPQQQQMPMQMPMPQPQQGSMASLRSGGLVSFGEDIKKAIKQNDQDIEPFLSGIEDLVKFRFGVDVSGGSQPTIGTTTPSTNIAEPQIVDAKSYALDIMTPKDIGKDAYDTMFTKDSDGILYPKMSAGRRPKDYFEGQVYDDRGDGMTDSINFKVEGDPVIKGAKLSADEYVLPADLVAMLGNGSSDAGAEKLDKFTKEMRVKAFGTPKQQKKINATKELRDMV